MDDIEKYISKSTCGVCSDEFDNVYAFNREQLILLIELVAKEAFQAGIEREHNPFDNPNFDKWFNQVSDTLNKQEE